MIDLHSHILPGIDDGAENLNVALEMARMAAASGTTVLACTPHIKPPTYPNHRASIDEAVDFLKSQLVQEGIALELVGGADIHINHDLLDGLKSGHLPTINGSRYFLFEPDHNVMPPGLDRFCATILDAGFVPILTHPERLDWIERHYDKICGFDEMGVVMQLTANSVTGKFGKQVQKWSLRMLQENRVDIVASDAHDVKYRTTSLASVKEFLVKHFGLPLANRLLQENPMRILEDGPLAEKARVSITVAPQKSAWLNLMNMFSSK